MHRGQIPLLLVAAGFLAAACGASRPSAELVAARTAFQRIDRGPAAQLQPAEVLEARRALQRAESVHQTAAGSAEARDFAYLALRRAELAEARSRTIANDQARQESLQRLTALQQQKAQQTEGQLRQTQTELEKERLARLEAEQKAMEALKKIEDVAEVRQEARGVVITLSGSVLFASGKTTLLPTARERLDQLANVLKDQTDGQQMVIEGHADARGNDMTNQMLSLARAQAVRDYLVARGVPSDRVVAVGLGESAPLADNDTAEGRATNRRVEIVLQPTARPAGPGAEPAPRGTEERPDLKSRKDRTIDPEKQQKREKRVRPTVLEDEPGNE